MSFTVDMLLSYMFSDIPITFPCSLIPLVKFPSPFTIHYFVVEIARQAKDAKAKYIFTLEGLAETAKKVKRDCYGIRVSAEVSPGSQTMCWNGLTMITDLLNIIVAMNCYERAQALHAI